MTKGLRKGICVCRVKDIKDHVDASELFGATNDFRLFSPILLKLQNAQPLDNRNIEIHNGHTTRYFSAPWTAKEGEIAITASGQILTLNSVDDGVVPVRRLVRKLCRLSDKIAHNGSLPTTRWTQQESSKDLPS